MSLTVVMQEERKIEDNLKKKLANLGKILPDRRNGLYTESCTTILETYSREASVFKKRIGLLPYSFFEHIILCLSFWVPKVRNRLYFSFFFGPYGPKARKRRQIKGTERSGPYPDAAVAVRIIEFSAGRGIK